MITIEQIVAAWDWFFFRPIPVHSVALFRIAFSAIMLLDAFFLLANAGEYLGPDGLVGYDRYYRRSRYRSLSVFFFLPPTMASVYVILGVHITSLTMLALGFLTPVSNAIAFVTLRSIVNRNPVLCNGGDNVALMMCFLLMFAPSGMAYSLDDLAFHSRLHPDAGHQIREPWAQRLMQIQTSIIYVYTAYWKLKGGTYRDGTALHYALNNEEYQRFAVPCLLLRTPWVRLFTWGALLFEFAIGFGLWIRELSGWFVFAGIAFHLAIEFTLNVHLFGWYLIACLLLFVNSP